MDNWDETIFLKETTNAPNNKRSLKDDQNSKAKKAKIRCNVKPIILKKIETTETVQRAKNLEDNDNSINKTQNSETKTKDIHTRLNSTSEKFEDQIGDETEISTVEQIQDKNILLGDNASTSGSTKSNATYDARNPQDSACFISEHHGLGLLQTFGHIFTSPETMSNNFSSTNLNKTSKTNDNSNVFLEEQEKIGIPFLRISDSNGMNLYENEEEIDDYTNSSENVLEETESVTFKVGPSRMEENFIEKNAGELRLQRRNTENLKENATNFISETENKNNRLNTNNEELIKALERCNSPFADSNLKRCGHSNTNIDLPIIKNRKSKSKTATSNCTVANSNNRTENCPKELSQKTNLRTIIKNTMNDTHPELCLQDDIPMRLEIFFWDMLDRIGEEAENLIILSRKKHFNNRVLKYAIKLALEKMKKEANIILRK